MTLFLICCTISKLYISCLSFVFYEPRMLHYRTQWRNKFACLSFHKSSQIITVIAEHFDRKQDVSPAAPRPHSLVDHQPCRMKGECQGRWAHPTLRRSIVLQGGLFISGTPLWWLICAKRQPPLYTVQSFPLCCWVCLTQHLRDEHWVSSFGVTGPQHRNVRLV